jgi:hypothetical protein
MKYQEYRLKKIENLSSIDNANRAKELLNELREKQNLKPTEAAYIENFIFILPQTPQINGQSTLEIKSNKERKQIQKTKFENEHHQEKLEMLEKEYNLKQKDIDKIQKVFKQLINDKKVELDDLTQQIKALESVTIDIVHENELRVFYKNFNNHLNGLRSCLNTENTKLINNEDKIEFINKLDILQSFMDDFRSLLLTDDKEI